METQNLPPQAIMLDMLCGMMKTQAIHEAARLRIADLLESGPKHTAELAEMTGTQPAALYRLLATLASIGIFEEKEIEYFTQTPLSALLRSDVPGSMYNVAMIHGEQWQWRPWEALSYSLQTGSTAFNTLYGEGLFDYFSTHAEESERFSNAMRAFSQQVDIPLATGYDFSSLHTLVDIGGGYGSLLSAILRQNPQMKGILFELPHVIEEAETHITPEVRERCQLVTGNIFAPETLPQGADAYIMKQIIKDWDDEQAIQILTHCRQAMKPGGRILVAEQVLLPGRQMVTSKLLDLQLMVVLSGRERYEHQYRTLFEAAGLHLAKIWPTRSPYSLLEGVVATEV